MYEMGNEQSEIDQSPDYSSAYDYCGREDESQYGLLEMKEKFFFFPNGSVAVVETLVYVDGFTWTSTRMMTIEDVLQAVDIGIAYGEI